ncbi:MAG: hypothetical protein LBT24_05830, partial [Tannerella sp.]|nr:hypothetical protein [Tannerella sp.]
MKKLKISSINELDNTEIQDIAEIMETKAVRRSIDVVNWMDFPYQPIVVFDVARSDKYFYIHFFVRG